ncbi:hypothetical protein CALCODRAFT_432723 [Calocera cornea HHB12733]|uniref:Uncharacterized protein n=1 Tax=Calocera cornea HHB12733 TaxID=1353952 RepID=A0A165GSE9_9BASI|nr:hypothetical protein CALCODRAFT_432723 [Calocera cornea HHB12733]
MSSPTSSRRLSLSNGSGPTSATNGAHPPEQDAQPSEEDTFVHSLAIKLSRALNTLNPNDLLARRVIGIAEGKSFDEFQTAARSFGNFAVPFLQELYSEIGSHLLSAASGHAPAPVRGMTVMDSEVLEPDQERQGGLVQSGLQHTFRAPAREMTPRSSLLGLDRLAMEKRAAAALAEEDGERRKRQRLDDDAVFKMPPPRLPHPRQRPEDTPSRGPGLSDIARQRLEEHRKERDRQREGVRAELPERREIGDRGLGEFRKRGNRSFDERGRPIRDDGRERDNGWAGRNGRDAGNGRDGRNGARGWDATPRSSRSSSAREDGPSVRVPSIPWESTPRGSSSQGAQGNWPKDRRWDAPTPRAGGSRGASPDGRRDGGEGDGEWVRDMDVREWEEEQVRLDRDWYLGDDEGGVMPDQDDHNPFAQYEDFDLQKAAEVQVKQIKKISARQAQYNADNDLWEANRMLTSGVAQRRQLDLDFEDDAEATVHVMVHDLKPPFLDGRTVFTKQLEPINPIRDPTSDMAVFAKKGSALVREKREQAERAKAAAKLAALGGTALGNVMGIKDEEAGEEDGAFLLRC